MGRNNNSEQEEGNRRPIPLNEGIIKKGGLRSEPTTPRPNVTPGQQSTNNQAQQNQRNTSNTNQNTQNNQTNQSGQ